MLNLLSIQLVILACFMPFWASSRQTLLASRIAKLPAWLGFFALLIMAFLLLVKNNHWLSSLLMILVYVMCMWVLLVILSAYFSKKVIWVCLTYNIIFLVIAFVGVLL